MAPITTSRLLFRAAYLAFGLALMLTPLTTRTQLSNPEPVSGSLSGHRSQLRARTESVELPLSFEANRGQADPRVRFVSRGNGYSLLLTSNEAVIKLRAGLAALLCVVAISACTPSSSSGASGENWMASSGASTGS